MKHVLLIGLLALAACGDQRPPLAEPDASTKCAQCGMSVVDRRFVSQIVVEGRPPRFLDDFNCLAGHLKAARDLPASAQVFVADHRTKEWVPVQSAVFTRVKDHDTPMGSGMAAHANATSRDADPFANGGETVALGEAVPGLAR